MEKNTTYYAVIAGFLFLCLASLITISVFGIKGLSSPRVKFATAVLTPTEGMLEIETPISVPSMPSIAPTETLDITKYPVFAETPAGSPVPGEPPAQAGTPGAGGPSNPQGTLPAGEPPNPQSTPPAAPEGTIQPETVNTQQPEWFPTETPLPVPQATLIPSTPTSIPANLPAVCGAKGSMTFLSIWYDNNNLYPPYGADAIRLVKINFSEKKINIVAIPRTLWLSTPSLINTYNVSGIQLNSLYQIIKDSFITENEGVIKATNAVAQTVFDNFGVISDHFITMDSDTLTRLVDTLGGIEVNVTEAVTLNGTSFQQGSQVFDSSRTLIYLQGTSQSDNEWSRIMRQNSVYAGLHKRVANPAVLSKVPTLYEQYKGILQTDMTVEQMTSVICMLKEVSPDQAKNAEFWQSVTNTQSDETIQIPDLGKAREMFTQFLNN